MWFCGFESVRVREFWNRGKGFKLCVYWRVYCEDETRKTTKSHTYTHIEIRGAMNEITRTAPMLYTVYIYGAKIEKSVLPLIHALCTRSATPTLRRISKWNLNSTRHIYTLKRSEAQLLTKKSNVAPITVFSILRVKERKILKIQVYIYVNLGRNI